MNHHLASSKRAGLTEEDWKALRDPEHAERFSDKEKAALHFADKLTHTPTGDIRYVDTQNLKKYFTEPEMVEIVTLVALVNLTNRITDGLKLDLEMEEHKVEGRPAIEALAA